MIFIENNFLTSKVCEEIIQIYERNKNLAKLHRDTYPLKIEKIEESRSLFQEIYDQVFEICTFHKRKDDELSCRNYEIVKWPVGSHMKYHTDNYPTAFSVIIYLNDEYEGGETDIYRDIKIKPKQGKLLIISETHEIYHKVNVVEGSPRYTLPIWITRKHI